ncbi:MAG: hypothetical protein ACLPSW_27030 [Roseiarcus sp.]
MTRFNCLGFGPSGGRSFSGVEAPLGTAAGNAHKTGRGLRDVEPLAGHKSIEVTQGYVDGESRGQRRLVAPLELARATGGSNCSPHQTSKTAKEGHYASAEAAFNSVLRAHVALLE